MELKHANASRLTLLKDMLLLLNIVSKCQDMLPLYEKMVDYLKSSESIAKEQQKIIERYENIFDSVEKMFEDAGV